MAGAAAGSVVLGVPAQSLVVVVLLKTGEVALGQRLTVRPSRRTVPRVGTADRARPVGELRPDRSPAGVPSTANTLALPGVVSGVGVVMQHPTKGQTSGTSSHPNGQARAKATTVAVETVDAYLTQSSGVSVAAVNQPTSA